MKIECPNCDASGVADKKTKWEKTEHGKSCFFVPCKCFLCRGTGYVTEKRLSKETLKKVERLARQNRVVILQSGGWSAIRFWGHYRSSTVKVLNLTKKTLTAEFDNWITRSIKHFDRQTGWRRGLKLRHGKSEWEYWIAEESLTAVNRLSAE